MKDEQIPRPNTKGRAIQKMVQKVDKYDRVCVVVVKSECVVVKWGERQTKQHGNTTLTKKKEHDNMLHGAHTRTRKKERKKQQRSRDTPFANVVPYTGEFGLLRVRL